MTEHALQVEGLTKRFGSFTAVDHLSFHIDPGEIFGFLGPNGAGKSTTIRMLCGVLPPTSGRAFALGFDLFRQARSIRRRIGYLSQKFSLLRDLTVFENLRFFGSLYGLEGQRLRQEVEHRLKDLQLWAARDQNVSALSTGERQRVALASATLHQPQLLFLDEPTSGVDPLRRRQFWETMDDLARQGMTLLVTTHNLSEVDPCDRLAFILNGRIVACDRPRSLREATGLWTLVVKSPAYRALYETIRTLPGLRNAVLQGRSVRVTYPDGLLPETFLQPLRAQGWAFDLQGPERPSLEDLFVDLVRQHRSTP